MQQTKLFDAEWRLMEILWAREPLPAKEISRLAAENIGWNKNTTYTVLKKLVEKNVLRRDEPNFICVPLLRHEEAARAETHNLIERLYGGSKKAFFAAFAQDESLTEDEIAALRSMIDGMPNT